MGGKSNFSKKTIRDVDLGRGTRVILSPEFDVPLDERGEISNDYRLRRALPTIEYLINKGCRTTIVTKLGRPDGKRVAGLSLAPIAKWLSHQLEAPVGFVEETIGEKAEAAVNALEPGAVLLLENVRFHAEEEVGDAVFAKKLASYGDVFVGDAFGLAHRNHASITGISAFLPAVAGFLMEAEVSTINSAINNPNRPLLAVVGGAKISDKLAALEKLIKLADMVTLGGAVANTFLKASGMNVGASLIEEAELGKARELLEIMNDKQAKGDFLYYLPEDGVVASSTDRKASTRIVDWGSQTMADINAYPAKPHKDAYELSSGDRILDIGPISAAYIAALSRTARTVIWSGTLGLTETKPIMGTVGPFEHGSYRLLSAIEKKSAPKGQFSLVGGGDTSSYVLSVKGIEPPDHVSTGGSAALELIGGAKLPGVECLQDKS